MKISRRKFIKGGLMTTSLLAGGLAAPVRAESLFPAHPPLGKGQGINPGRVVWIHEPESVLWNGEGYWWQPQNFNESLVSRMVRDGIKLLTSQDSPARAWQALFAWRNALNGRNGGYEPGQKLVIKPNMNGSGEYGPDPDGLTRESYGNAVLLRALLLSLVEDGGLKPSDIIIYDVCRTFPAYMQKLCASGPLAGVGFRQRDPGGQTDAAADPNAQIHWAGPVSGSAVFFPKCLTEADYLINLANLKGHSWGLTLGAKNHFGSFVNEDRLRTPQAAGLHGNIINSQPGGYSVLADLLARKQLTGKTVLWMLDGLITTPGEIMAITAENSLWEMPPFNGRQAASLFFSQDPLALDSVGADFLVNEPVMRRFNSNMTASTGMENYLHEAALLPNPPSGIKYTDGVGGVPASPGVHEHWNNAVDKLYSRNRGGSEGIELVKNP